MNKSFYYIASISTQLILAIIAIYTLTSCSTVPTQKTQPSLPPSATKGMYNTTLWEGDTALTWDKLQHNSITKLTAMRNNETDAAKRAWIDLALISKRNSINTQQLSRELLTWREQYPNHPANELMPDNNTLNQLTNTSQPQRIAVLLPQNGSYASAGQNVREGFLNAYYKNLAKTGKQNIKFYDTTQAQNMTALYQQAIADGADFIVGPLVKSNVLDLSNNSSFNVPTLALNYTEVRYSSLPTNFYQYGLLPEDEAGQLADRARLAGHSHALIIAPQNSWGNRLVTAFTKRWQTSGGSIQDTMYYSAKSDLKQQVATLLRINPTADKKLMQQHSSKSQLEQQRRQDFDVVFLFAQPKDGRAIVPLLKYYYVNDVPIFATSSLHSKKMTLEDADLNGVIVCDIPWNMKSPPATDDGIETDKLYAVGQDAYLLSQTLQRLNQLPNFPIYGSTGALTLAPNHQIHRRLPCAPIYVR